MISIFLYQPTKFNIIIISSFRINLQQVFYHMTRVEVLRSQLQQYSEKFARARQYLGRVDLSFFNSSTDQSNLRIAKDLTQRGQRSCWFLLNQLNRIVGNLNATEINQLDQALLHGPPPHQWNLALVFSIVSAIASAIVFTGLEHGLLIDLLGIPGILLGVLGIPGNVSKIPSQGRLPFAMLAGLAVGGVFTALRSFLKSYENKSLIERFLGIQNFVLYLETSHRNLVFA